MDCSKLDTLGAGIPVEVLNALNEETLNKFMAMGRPVWSTTRNSIQQLLSDESSKKADVSQILISQVKYLKALSITQLIK